MKLTVLVGPAAARIVPIRVWFVTENNLEPLPAALAGPLRRCTEKEFHGADRQLHLLNGPETRAVHAERVLVAGLGKPAELSPEKIRRTVGAAIKRISSLGLTAAALHLGPDQLVPAVEAALLADYRFTRFKAPKDQPSQLAELSLVLPARSDLAAARASVQTTQIVCEAANFVRELGNLPPNLITPDTLAGEAKRVARQHQLKCTVLGMRELRQRGFGGILAVGGGSQNEPRLIVLEYTPAARPKRQTSRGPIALVGKALTFDSGGISIKPAERMDEMKFDKCGGLAVLGAMRAIAQLRLPQPVIGIIGAAENMPSSSSYRPGDIVTSYPGKDKRGITIEVLNTDAEGRIVLGDALAYARERGATQIIDLATLTGACVVALGHHAAGLFGNDETLVSQLRAAGEATGERCWPMPLWPDYKDLIKSDVADHKNTGGRYAGASTAAAFLAKYVGDTPWAHLDIAGTAWITEERPYLGKGATGFGLRLLLHWLQQPR